MKSKLAIFALLLLIVSAKAQTPIPVSISDDCSQNGVSKIFAITGNAIVSSTSGRSSCVWVQLWEKGPRWATFNVGATITNYANQTVGADATSYNNNVDQASYYNTANVGGLYAWNQPNYNGRKTTWTNSVTTGVADVATTLWGSNWKTPTRPQLDTLQSSYYNKTIWTWCDGSTTQYVPGCTLKGYKVSGVGAYADKSIFLPAVGFFNHNYGLIYDASNNGRYWSGTPQGSGLFYAWDFSFITTNRRGMSNDNSMFGLAVRAVLAETNSTAVESNSTQNKILTLYASGCSKPNTFICTPGQQLLVSATPMAHRHFVMWNDGNTDNPRLVTVNQNATYTATFASDSFDISVLASPISYGSISGAGRYEYNSVAQLAATPNYGYVFSHWNDENADNPRSITVIEDKIYTATFVKRNFSIIVNSSDTKQGSVSGSGSFEYQSECTITASPEYGYHFTQWSDGNTDNPRTVIVTSDTTLIASFAKNKYTITTSVQNENGTTSGDTIAEYLTQIQISAVADYGWQFSHWNDENDDNPRTITIMEDKEYNAIFVRKNFSVSLLSANTTMGTVYGSGNYEYESSATISANGLLGYEFYEWSDNNTENPRTVVITGDTTFTATFRMQKQGECGENLHWEYRDNVLYISGFGAMYDYSTLTQPWYLYRDSIHALVLNSGITSIGTYAFYGLGKITELTLPEGLTTIGAYAFSDCNHMTEIIFSSTISSIGEYAFYNCIGVLKMTNYATESPEVATNALTDISSDAYLYVPVGYKPLYQSNSNWTRFILREIGEIITTIESVNVYMDIPSKVERDGQVFILRGNRLYDLRGQEVK